jgi:hypothetical protein
MAACGLTILFLWLIVIDTMDGKTRLEAAVFFFSMLGIIAVSLIMLLDGR